MHACAEHVVYPLADIYKLHIVLVNLVFLHL